MEEHLLPCQRAAISAIRAHARAQQASAASEIAHILRMSNVPASSLAGARAGLDGARVAVHFHPDRPVGGRLVASALLHDGVYRNQFDTGISNGLVTAFRGGARDAWEQALFEDAYADPDVSLSHRPKYGALDLTGASDGPAPRFGSCYFLLKNRISARTTFTFGGSQDAPKVKGTIDEMDAILAALLTEAFTRDFMLGVTNIRPAGVIDRLCELQTAGNYTAEPSRNLDHVIEAQIHGDLCLDTDVEALVADASFSGMHELQEMGRKYGFPVHFRRSFHMAPDEMPSDFRGAGMPSLAARVARHGTVDAAAIGAAAQALMQRPEEWADRGGVAEVLQELKLLWHVLVRYG